MHAVAGERVQVDGERRDEGLSFTGLHLGDPAEVQRHATHQLDVEVALADRAPRGLAHHGEGLDEQVVQVLAAVEALFELDGHVRRAPRRRAPATSVSSALIERHDGGEVADLLALARTKDLREHAHDGPVVRRGPCHACCAGRTARLERPAAQPATTGIALAAPASPGQLAPRRELADEVVRRRRRSIAHAREGARVERLAVRGGEVDELALAGAAREHLRVLPGGALDDDLLDAPDAGPVARERRPVDHDLQPCETLGDRPPAARTVSVICAARVPGRGEKMKV